MAAFEQRLKKLASLERCIFTWMTTLSTSEHVCESPSHTPHSSSPPLRQQYPPASRTPLSQHTFCTSTTLAVPPQTPHASRRPTSQQSAEPSRIAFCAKLTPMCFTHTLNVASMLNRGEILWYIGTTTLPLQVNEKIPASHPRLRLGKSGAQTAYIFTAGAVEVHDAMLAAVASRIQYSRALRRDLAIGTPVSWLTDTHPISAHTLRSTDSKSQL